MKKLSFNELKENTKYIATDKDGRKYEATYVNKYAPGGVVFCVYPSYTSDGTENELLYFEEV